MGAPMAPSPTKPTRIFFALADAAFGGRARHYRGLGMRTEYSQRARCGNRVSVAEKLTRGRPPRRLVARVLGLRNRGRRWRGRVEIDIRHAATGVLDVLARLRAIRIGVRIREELATAVSAGLVDAP